MVVTYETVDGSAIAGVDYTAQSGMVTIASGALDTTVSVPVIGNTLSQSDRSFNFELDRCDQLLWPAGFFGRQERLRYGR